MRRQLVGTLLWCLLLPLAGSVRLLAFVLHLAGRFRPKTLLLFGGLALVLTTRSPLTAQLPLDRIFTQDGQSILFGGVVVLVFVVLVLGARSPISRRLWRRLRW